MKFVLLVIFQYFIYGSEGIVGGRQADVAPPDDPVVFVNYAGRFARVEGYRDKRSNLYVVSQTLNIA